MAALRARAVTVLRRRATTALMLAGLAAMALALALAGNAYVLAGVAGLLALFVWGVARAFMLPVTARLSRPELALGPAPRGQPQAISSPAD